MPGKGKTKEEMIKEALELYDKGDWDEALRIFNATRSLAAEKIIRLEECKLFKRLIDMYKGWVHWKKGHKEMAAILWKAALEEGSDEITQASAHAGLGIYYAEKGDKEQSLNHAKLAQELLPPTATMNHAINLNACAISLAKIGELDRAEQVLRKVMQINEQLEKADDPVIAKKAKHQLAKNWYNLASLIYITQGKFEEAINGLTDGSIPRYTDVGAETDLAAAHHRVAEAYEKMAETGETASKIEELDQAFIYEKESLVCWRKHPDDPSREETARKNLQRIKEKIEKLEQ